MRYLLPLACLFLAACQASPEIGETYLVDGEEMEVTDFLSSESACNTTMGVTDALQVEGLPRTRAVHLGADGPCYRLKPGLFDSRVFYIAADEFWQHAERP